MAVIEDFESGNLSEYSGDTANFGVSGSYACEGSYGLGENSGQGTRSAVYRTDITTQQGGVYTWYSRVDDVMAEMGLVYGFQDTQNYYYAGIYFWSSPYLEIHKVQGGNDTCLARSASSLSDWNAWHKLTLTWTSNGDHMLEWDDGTNQASVNDTTWSFGGMGWCAASPLSYLAGQADYLEEPLLEPYQEYEGTVLLMETGGVDSANYLIEAAGQSLLCCCSGVDLQRYQAGTGQAILVGLGGIDEQLLAECQGQSILAGIGTSDFQAHNPVHAGESVLTVVGSTDTAVYSGEHLGVTAAIVLSGSDQTKTNMFEHLSQVLLAAHSGLDLQNYLDYAGQSLRTALDFWAMQTFPLRLSLPDLTGRRIAWDTPTIPEDSTFLVLADGQVLGETSERTYDLRPDLEVRQYLQAGHPRSGPVRENALRTPKDRVRLRWTGDAASYQVWRQVDGGDWQQIAETALTEYLDGPLADGAWNYKVVAVDEEGDRAESDVANLTVSSAPEPPSGLDWSWNADTHTLTLTWQASGSVDVTSYRLRSSEGQAELDLASVPVQDSPALSYQQIFTTETGTWIFSVRAVDSGGNEEANITHVLAIPFEDGAPASRPAEPRLVEARAISGGRIEQAWLYDPRHEENGPGAAHEARIYWDAGTGEMDWTAPYATVEMNHATQATRYTWQSEPLTDGQEYRFVVRIATAAHPDGIETRNTEHYSATPSGSRKPPRGWSPWRNYSNRHFPSVKG